MTANAEYYTLGHLARFVQPGAVRIASTSFGTTGWNGQIMDAAFRNPDGSTALVVHNENDNPRTFAVAQGDASFDYTLPGGALATFAWPASRALDNGLRLLPADPMIAMATSGGADAAKAVDDDASTRWTTGAAQQPGQTLQVDLGSVVAARRLVLDTGPDTVGLPARLLRVHQRRWDDLVGAADRLGYRAAHQHRASRRSGALRARGPDRHRRAMVDRRRPARIPLTGRAARPAIRISESPYDVRRFYWETA